MIESNLIPHSVTVKGNLKQIRYDDVVTYCRDVLHGNFVI